MIPGMKRSGNVSYGRRTHDVPALFGGSVIPKHDESILFVATAAPIGEDDEEFQVRSLSGNQIEVVGPGVPRLVYERSQLKGAKYLVKILAGAFDAGRHRVTRGF